MTDLAKAAQWYGAHAIPVFRLVPRDKVPPEGSHGFLDATTDTERIAAWWRETPDANIGMPTGEASGILVVDCDPRNGGPSTRADLIERFGPTPETAEAITGGGGRHFFFRHVAGAKCKVLAPGVDLKADGGYVVLPPSIHPSGKAYEWDGIAGAKNLLTPAAVPVPEQITARNGNGTGHAAKIPEKIPDGEKHRTCVSLAGSMRRRGCNSEEIFAALLKLSERFESAVPPKNLRAIAEDIEERYEPEIPAPAEPTVEPQEIRPDLTGYLSNDYGNTGRLIALYGRDIRYCHAFKKWLVWDGRRWSTDETDQARKLAKLAMLEAFTQAVRKQKGKDAERFALGSLDCKRITSALSMAQCELPIAPAELDTQPFLLNCLNGTIDLRTGHLQEHQREDFLTKLVRFNYRPQGGCPTFMRFLERIMGGGPDAPERELERAGRLIEYLQKAVGYSLTGTTSEKVVFMPYGPGNNGKTTLLSTFLKILEEYAVLLQIDTLMVRQESNNTQADLADLRGARFVMTSETEEGQRLAEGKLKRITQGMGRIKAVRKYENPIEFQESHKLWMDANHRPVVRGTDNAIWNRLHPIPFGVIISDEEIDRELPGKLMAEAEGILAWAVAGAIRWFKDGLGRPPEVEKERLAWRGNMDQVGRFIEERCTLDDLAQVRNPDDLAQVRGRELYAAYRKWCEESGERTIRENEFSQRIVERGPTKKRTNKGAVYSGIGLTSDVT